MKNLGSVMAAYMIGWAVFFFYFVSVARRTSELRKEIQRLKESMSRRAAESVTRGK
jgi:CcmD family protein